SASRAGSSWTTSTPSCTSSRRRCGSTTASSSCGARCPRGRCTARRRAMPRPLTASMAALAVVAAGCGGHSSGSTSSSRGTGSAPSTTAARPTRCVPGRMTPEQTEGPFYRPGSPARERVDQGATGQPLVLAGQVFSASCRPVAHVRLEFWQADGRGQYDNAGYRLRGHELTDARGRYRLVTVYPGLYTGRTRHIHVKVEPPGG